MVCKLKKSWVSAELKEHGHLFEKKDKLRMAKNITRDHVAELGCSYYPELFRIERKLKNSKKKK